MERKLEIDTVRGLACLLLVGYHVVGETDTGLQITTGLLRDINDYLAYVRMPLFTFLSGYVYAYRPFRSGAKAFIAGKARRLLIPLLVVGTLFAVVRSAIPGTNSEVDNWYMLHLEPVAHFWFIESLFIIFLAVMLLEYVGWLKNLYRLSIVFLIACLLYLFVFGLHLFSISGSIYLLPYFIAGLACYRFSLIQNIKLPLIAAAWLVCAVYLVWQNHGELVDTRSLAALMFGISTCVLLIKPGAKVRLLSYIGIYSYAIYLFHAFFTGASRIALLEFGVDSIVILLVVGCALGVAGPIVVEKFASRNRIANTALLGKKWEPGLPWLPTFKIYEEKT